MAFLKAMGLSPNKMVLGLAVYARSYVLQNKLFNQINAATNEKGFSGSFTKTNGILSYYELCDWQNKAVANDGLKEEWQPLGMMPYMYNEAGEWVCFENEESLANKIEYVIGNEMAGVSVNSMDMDDFRGISCNKGKYPFLKWSLGLLLLNKKPEKNDSEQAAIDMAKRVGQNTPAIPSQVNKKIAAITAMPLLQSTATIGINRFILSEAMSTPTNPNDFPILIHPPSLEINKSNINQRLSAFSKETRSKTAENTHSRMEYIPYNHYNGANNEHIDMGASFQILKSGSNNARHRPTTTTTTTPTTTSTSTTTTTTTSTATKLPYILITPPSMYSASVEHVNGVEIPTVQLLLEAIYAKFPDLRADLEFLTLTEEQLEKMMNHLGIPDPRVATSRKYVTTTTTTMRVHHYQEKLLQQQRQQSARKEMESMHFAATLASPRLGPVTQAQPVVLAKELPQGLNELSLLLAQLNLPPSSLGIYAQHMKILIRQSNENKLFFFLLLNMFIHQRFDQRGM